MLEIEWVKESVNWNFWTLQIYLQFKFMLFKLSEKFILKHELSLIVSSTWKKD